MHFPTEDMNSTIEDILLSAIIFVALIFVFFGLRILRVTLFFTGAMIGLVCTCIVLDKYIHIEEIEGFWSYIIGAFVGVILGAILQALIPLGIFLLGALFGLFCVIEALSIRDGGFIPNKPGQYVILAVVPFATGVLAFWKDKLSVILSTSWAGSFLVWICIDRLWRGEFYKVPGFLLEYHSELIKAGPKTFGEIVGWVLLALTGTAWQWWQYRKAHLNEDPHENHSGYLPIN